MPVRWDHDANIRLLFAVIVLQKKPATYAEIAKAFGHGVTAGAVEQRIRTLRGKVDFLEIKANVALSSASTESQGSVLFNSFHLGGRRMLKTSPHSSALEQDSEESDLAAAAIKVERVDSDSDT
ncbi:hypothetical protein RUND412_003885 [Rhizina undulata]